MSACQAAALNLNSFEGIDVNMMQLVMDDRVLRNNANVPQQLNFKGLWKINQKLKNVNLHFVGQKLFFGAFLS